MKWTNRPMWVLIVGIVLAACGPAPSSSPEAVEDATEETQTLPTVSAGESAEEGYPAAPAQSQPVADAYPAAPEILPLATDLPEGYPAQPTEAFLEPRFRFETVLHAGDEMISGQGPPNLALTVADVTFNGEVIGSGVIDSDGHFEISVQPLAEGHRVGITFGEFEPGLDIAGMSNKYFPYRGEGFVNVPNVGLFLESAMVQP